MGLLGIMFLRRRESSESNWVGRGTEPCLDFSIGYRKPSPKISKEKRRFLVVVASGGLNQHRNQIVDAVVIARILEAALVVPVLQVNLIWGDERIADAELNLGETEVREAHLAKATYFIQIGDKEKALEQLKVTESKTVAVRQKMDLVFHTLQLGFF